MFMAQRGKPIARFGLVFLLFLLHTSAVASESHIVKTLPGYPDPLPFKLETGYIGVGENEEVQYFYYFVESENDPDKDPLVLWLTGGPGCSGFSGLIYEIGPLRFNVWDSDGSTPSLLLNQYSWTKVASIIFVDSPAGIGFSYANTPRGYNSSDTKTIQECYTFLKKWLMYHPKFGKNRLYIAGDSYGGKIVPTVAWEIAKGNEAGEHKMPLKGYLIGNSITDEQKDSNERIPFAHRMALISDTYFERAKLSCDGEYVSPDPNNVECHNALRPIKECLDHINHAQILDPYCHLFVLKTNDGREIQEIIGEDSNDILFMRSKESQHCRNNNYEDSYVWANDQSVQEALYVRKGTIKEWIRCNKNLTYERDIQSVLSYHRIMFEKGYQILAYSGDHDFLIPYMATIKWIRSLNLTVDEKWRPWMVDGQVAGYTEKHGSIGAYVTFATVKGAGHTAPEYMPKQCLAMVERWFALFPL